jgi:hypothetical protein
LFYQRSNIEALAASPDIFFLDSRLRENDGLMDFLG